MAKGSGGGGHGGGGGKKSVAGGGGGAPAAELQSIIKNNGGVWQSADIPYRAEFLKKDSKQMRSRSVEYYTGQLSGAKTAAEKNAITKSWKPIELYVEKGRGKWKTGLNDGRHRLYSAQKMGATKIPAKISYKGKDGEYHTVTTMVKV